VSSPQTPAAIQAAQSGDREALTWLVEENAGLIWSIVGRCARPGQEREDLYQLGALGLIKAVQGFDPSYGTQFSTYAVPKIAGEIRRFLRDDGPVKVSRRMKEQALTIHRARASLCELLGREPALSELAAETGLTPEEIAAADLASSPVISLQAENGEAGLTLETTLGGEAPEEALVEHLALQAARRRLPQREQTLLTLRYDRGLTQQQTAKILGISQVQVSRLEKKALAFLRQELT
jgi:RNA polymerase sporulation-specific sigma factor